MHVKQNEGSVTEYLFIVVFLFIYLIIVQNQMEYIGSVLQKQGSCSGHKYVHTEINPTLILFIKGKHLTLHK